MNDDMKDGEAIFAYDADEQIDGGFFSDVGDRTGLGVAWQAKDGRQICRFRFRNHGDKESRITQVIYDSKETMLKAIQAATAAAVERVGIRPGERMDVFPGGSGSDFQNWLTSVEMEQRLGMDDGPGRRRAIRL